MVYQGTIVLPLLTLPMFFVDGQSSFYQVLLFLSWCIITAWKSNNTEYKTSAARNPVFYDEIHFFLSATVIPFFITLVIFLLILCGAHNRIERGHWILTVRNFHSKILADFLYVKFPAIICETVKSTRFFKEYFSGK